MCDIEPGTLVRATCLTHRESEEGVVTAYLPDDEQFAILFSCGLWVSFIDTEDKFLERITVMK